MKAAGSLGQPTSPSRRHLRGGRDHKFADFLIFFVILTQAVAADEELCLGTAGLVSRMAALFAGAPPEPPSGPPEQALTRQPAPQLLNTGRWYDRVFQSPPDQIWTRLCCLCSCNDSPSSLRLSLSRAMHDWLPEGRQKVRQEVRQEGEATDTLRQINHRCGLLRETTTAQSQALPSEQLEALVAWLAANSTNPA